MWCLRPLPNSLSFSKETHLAGILPHFSVSFSLCFPSKMHLEFSSHCEFTCDAANRSLIANIFPRNMRLAQKGFLGVTDIAIKFSFAPKQEEGQMLRKKHCKGSLLWAKAMLGYVTPNSSKRMSLRNNRLGGCPRRHTTEGLLKAWRWRSAPNAETR